jgi:uncharacterized membrane protein
VSVAQRLTVCYTGPANDVDVYGLKQKVWGMDDQRTMQRRGWGGQPERRPHIVPPASAAEQALVALSVVALVALIVTTAYWWAALPATIPTHFGIDGKPNAYGSKNSIWLLPGILLAITVAFSLLSRYPWLFNYPVTITEENAERQYHRGRVLLAVINAGLALLFVVIQWQTIQVSRGAATSLGAFFSLPYVIAFIALVPISAIILIVVWSLRGK